MFNLNINNIEGLTQDEIMQFTRMESVQIIFKIKLNFI